MQRSEYSSRILLQRHDYHLYNFQLCDTFPDSTSFPIESRCNTPLEIAAFFDYKLAGLALGELGFIAPRTPSAPGLSFPIPSRERARPSPWRTEKDEIMGWRRG